MKAKYISLILIIICLKSIAQKTVTSEILQSTYLIKSGNETATSFLISVDSSDYLITARHLFLSLILHKSTVDIEIFKNSGWLHFKPTLLLDSNANIDIAVLNLHTNNRKQNPFEIGVEGSYLSEECFFLGFPFGLKMNDDTGGKMNQGFPLPFVKKALISSFMTDSSGVTQIFLDGHNNPGFSGGPVVILNQEKNGKYNIKVIGVISAYINENKIIKTPLGDFTNSENSGIVVCYIINPIYNIINRK